MHTYSERVARNLKEIDAGKAGGMDARPSGETGRRLAARPHGQSEMIGNAQ